MKTDAVVYTNHQNEDNCFDGPLGPVRNVTLTSLRVLPEFSQTSVDI